jgi:hypothetical protein
LPNAEFTTLRLRLIKIAARVMETGSRVRVAFAAAHPEANLFRVLLVGRQVAEVGKIGHPKLASWAPWSRQLFIDWITYQP